MKKKFIAILLVLLMVFACSGTALAFSDTNGHWAGAAINAWSEQGVLKGYSDDTFRPNNYITRAEFAVMLNRILAYTDKGSAAFNDVAAGDWFSDSVLALANAGVVNGYADGGFHPNAFITRQEACAMLTRAFKLAAGNIKLADKFTDAADIAVWAESAVSAMVSAGYISGYPDNTFKPNAFITRAEVVTVVNNARYLINPQVGGSVIGRPNTSGDTGKQIRYDVPEVDEILSLKAYSALTYYGVGCVKVEVTYKKSADLSGIQAQHYNLIDRGNLTPDWGELVIDKIDVNGQVVTLYINRDTTANESNNLIYAGDEATGSRTKDNNFGLNVTSSWYREIDGDIATGGGYQFRELELKLWHQGESELDALCLADEKGNYQPDDRWLETEIEYFTSAKAASFKAADGKEYKYSQGGFMTFEELGIAIPSSADLPAGNGVENVLAYVYFPANYSPNNEYPLILSLPGGGTALWDKVDADGNRIAWNPYGPTFFDGSAINWAATGSDAIVIYMDHSYKTGASKDCSWFGTDYSFIEDDMAVIDYFIKYYGANEDHVILTGNSQGTVASSAVIKANPGRISTFICCNGDWSGGSDFRKGIMDAYDLASEYGLSVWIFDGELDSSREQNTGLMTYARGKYAEQGWTPGQIYDKLRHTGIAAEYNYYWGETDHSATKFVYWYLLDDLYYGPNGEMKNGVLTWADDQAIAIKGAYHLDGRYNKATGVYALQGYDYYVYGDTLRSWALSPEREIDAINCELTVDDVVSIQPYSELTYYGVGVTRVDVTYKAGVDVTDAIPSWFTLTDLGNLSPDRGELVIDSVDVNGQVVTLNINRDTTANATNNLIYAGDEMTGSRTKDNNFGLNVTSSWYREIDGDIATGGGYQFRENELKFYHQGEDESVQLCQAVDKTGKYDTSASNKFEETYIEYFSGVTSASFTDADGQEFNYSQGGFMTFEELGIEIASSADLPEGNGVENVLAYVYFPKDYNPQQDYPLILSLPGGGTALWDKVDESGNRVAWNPYGPTFFDGSAINWAADGSEAIVIYMDHSYRTGASAGCSWTDTDYSFIEDDMAVIDYFIDNYGANEDHVILTGNSQGTVASSAVIKANPGRISTFICCNGDWSGGSDFRKGIMDAYDLASEYGLSVWIFDGELDSSREQNTGLMTYARGKYAEQGWTPGQIYDKLRHTGIAAEYNYYWGETDHSATKFVYWYLLDNLYYGPNGEMQNGILTWAADQAIAIKGEYHLDGRYNKTTGAYALRGYNYYVYGDTLQSWALSPEREIDSTYCELTVDDVVSIQPYSELTYYGVGVTKVDVTYAKGVDVTDANPSWFTLTDLGNLSPVRGELEIADVEVNGQVVTLYIDRDTTANADNNLIYAGDEMTGSRTKDNNFGLNVTSSWYREIDGDIATGGGYQFRENELKFYHQGEDESVQLCQAIDATGKYDTDPANKFAETYIEYFTDVESASFTDANGVEFNYSQGGFMTFEELGIEIASSADLPAGNGVENVLAYVYFPKNYSPNNEYPLILSLPGGGTALWDKVDESGNRIAWNPYGPTFFDGSAINWAADGANAIVIYMDHSYRTGASAGCSWTDTAYSYIEDDMAVIDYFIDNYGANEDHVILTGNSQGTVASSAVIKANPGRISTFICCNGDWSGGSDFRKGIMDAYDLASEYGLSVWIFDGELDSSREQNTGLMTYARQKYAAEGWSKGWIYDNLRHTGIAAEYNYYWGETDHSATKFVYWYLLDNLYYGPNGEMQNGALVWAPEQSVPVKGQYNLDGRYNATTGKYALQGYNYYVYGDTLASWALSPEREIDADYCELTVDDIVSIQPYSELTYYGVGVTKVDITYKKGVDVTDAAPGWFKLSDLGNLTPDRGYMVIDSVDVNGQTVTLHINRDTTANESNSLNYNSGRSDVNNNYDPATGEIVVGARSKDNNFGLNVTSAWYREIDGDIVVGKGGYQFRESELKLYHAGEDSADQLCQAIDATGAYDTDPANKFAPTNVEYFTDATMDSFVDVNGDEYFYSVGGFKTFAELGIKVPSSNGLDGEEDEVGYVLGYVAFPKDYNPNNEYPILLSLPGGGTALWDVLDADGNRVAWNPYGPTFFDGSAINWYADGSDAIIIYMDHSYKNATSANSSWFGCTEYASEKDDIAVIDYFIDHYGANEDHVILTGNSAGTGAATRVIKTYPARISTYICCNGTWDLNSYRAGDFSIYEAAADYGLSVWSFDGELDSNTNKDLLQYARQLYLDNGYTKAQVADKLRHTGIAKEYNYYWGETDHSATKFVYWYLLDDLYYGPNGTMDKGVLTWADEDSLSIGAQYTLRAQYLKNGSYVLDNYPFYVYGNTLKSWALSAAREIDADYCDLTVDDIVSVQPYSELTYYGVGVTKVVITYDMDADLSHVTAEDYHLQDRGNTAPVFGDLRIANVASDLNTVTIYIDWDTAANANNTLYYNAEDRTGTGNRSKDNVFGLNVTSNWYWDKDRNIGTGSGYQFRVNELKLWHDGETEADALCQSDAQGQYLADSKIAPTEIKYISNVDTSKTTPAGKNYTSGGFATFADLGINIDSSTVLDGDYILGHVAFPKNYDPARAEKYPLVLSFPGGGTAYWDIYEDGQVIANNAYGAMYFDGSAFNWYAEGADAIVIYVDHRFNPGAKSLVQKTEGADYTYSWVEDDKRVCDYFIENYNVDKNHIIVTGNSAGTQAGTDFLYFHPDYVSVFICCNGRWGSADYGKAPLFTEYTYEQCAKYGLSVWCMDGERDHNNNQGVTWARNYYGQPGYDGVLDDLRISCIDTHYNYYWGETDHSATKFTYWYALNDIYYGPGHIEDGEIVFDSTTTTTYELQGRKEGGVFNRDGFVYQVYTDQTLMEWALSADRILDTDMTGPLGTAAD